MSDLLALLLALPLGRALAFMLPSKRFSTFGLAWSLNPGPFNIKEHVVITVMAKIAASIAYTTNVALVQKITYQQEPGLGYQIALGISTSTLGYSLVGMLRPFVVSPSSMVWPTTLVDATIINMLHINFGQSDSNYMLRWKFFLLALGCSFIWSFVPGYLWTGLSIFNWVCWIVPNDVVVNVLFGTNSGLGMSLFTFDWVLAT